MKPVAPRALRLVAQRLEEFEGRVIEAWPDPEDRAVFRTLVDAGAFKLAKGPPPAVLCPGCALTQRRGAGDE